VDTSIVTPFRSGTRHAWRSTLKREAVAAAYLRAAHAYILISMPTGTSTIFGVFQAILGSPFDPDELRPPPKLMPNENFASEIFGHKPLVLCCIAKGIHKVVRPGVKTKADQAVQCSFAQSGC
jgi:hypothetical protein